MNSLQIRRILVPTDLSEASRVELEYAVLFARTFDARLRLFYAEPIPVQPDLFSGAPVYFTNATPEEIARATSDIRAYAEPSLKGRTYDIVVSAGDAVPAVVSQAAEWEADMIVMATHGLRGWKRAFLGSCTEGVLQSAPCPVLSLARTDRNPRPAGAALTRIVCPVNFSEIARESLRRAAGLATAFGSELVIVHVVEPTESGHADADEQRVRAWIAPEIQDRSTFREVLLRGDAAERILDCVEDLGADLLVIGAQQKFLRDETVIGTTTERLIRAARIPVLTMVRTPWAAASAA